MQRRHTEFFGPDLIRTPVLSGSPDVAAVQIAAALAQLRAPLTRDEASLRDHADFVRTLADHLFPDLASAVTLEAEEESGNVIATTIRVQTRQAMVLDCWLADDSGGGPTGTPPLSVEFLNGTVVREVIPLTSYTVLLPSTGLLTVRVTKPGAISYRWGAVLVGRARYSDPLQFRRGR